MFSIFFIFKFEYNGTNIYEYGYYNTCITPSIKDIHIHYPQVFIYNIHSLSVVNFVNIHVFSFFDILVKLE